MVGTWPAATAAAAFPGNAAAGLARRDSRRIGQVEQARGIGVVGQRDQVVAGGIGMRDPDDVMAWLRLTCAPGVGPVAAHLLLAAFGLPQQVLAQSVEALSAVVPKKQARTVLAAPGAALSALAARTLAWLGRKSGHC